MTAQPEDLQKDTTDYEILDLFLESVIKCVGEMDVNLRNEDVLSTMYEDLNHMRDEVKALAQLQKECPYELV